MHDDNNLMNMNEAYSAALIFVSSALGQTPVYTANGVLSMLYY